MRAAPLVLAGAMLGSAPAAGQAPALADLWRVADGTLLTPPAVADGPTGAFWNPAGVMGMRGLAASLEVVQTPDVVNVSGLLAGASYGISDHLGVGLLAGRLAVGDLIRTTSSPTAEGAEIPVHAQFAGAVAGLRVGPVTAGAAAQVHGTRLDGIDDGGVTFDVGIQATPIPGLMVGGATHLGDPVATTGLTTSYVLGARYAVAVPPVVGVGTRLFFRYGLTVREVRRAEHVGSVGVMLADRLLVDAGAAWLGGYGEGAWQPLLGLSFQAGAYRVGIARGSGVSDVGAAYRVTLGIGPIL